MNKLMIHGKDKEFVNIENSIARDIEKYLADKSNVIWLDIEAPTEEEMDILIDTFNFHTISVEDVIFPHNFPKIESFDDYLFLVIHAISTSDLDSSKISSKEINVYFGKNYIVTIHEENVRQISSIRQRCKTNPGMMAKGVDFVLHNILDSIAEGFFPILDMVNEKIDQVEEKVLFGRKNQKEVMEEILDLKRTLLELRKTVIPQRNVYGTLTRSEISFIKPKAMIYFRDVYDHMLRITDMIEAYRELLSATMEASFTIISTRMNETMKTLTIIATFMMPLTLITSFYGMNVKAPEFEWGFFGYLWVCGLMVLIAAGMYLYFKRNKWF
ncbi:MAG: magnesium/cobalt transporter CorA [Candidatus Firestonebacteria bacterium]